MPNKSESYIRTRLTLLVDRLISPELWPVLVDEEIDVLKKRVHCEHTACSAEEIENSLISRALEDFQLLFRPFSGVERELLNYTTQWYELVNLKVLIRGKFSGVNDSAIRKELTDMGGFASLPLGKLLETDDPHEMLRLLQQTPFSSLVRQARAILEKEQKNRFVLDASIDRLFFNGLKQRIRLIPGADQQPLYTAFATLMDRLNLLWLIRYRFSYRLSAAKTYSLLTATGYRLPANNLLHLARLETLEEVIEQLPQTLYQLLSKADNLEEIENLMEHYTLWALRNMLKRSSSLVTRVFCYVLIRESEIRMLHTIIKGKALQLDRTLIQRAMGIQP